MKLLLLLLIIALTSCHVSRQVATSTTTENTDIKHLRDSLAFVINHLNYEHEQQIRQITASGVTFNPTPCPDLRSFRASLDSIGKVNFDNAVRKDSIIQALQNKVSIDKNGAIKAEGAISAAYRTNSKIIEENTRLAKANDSLWSVHDSDQVKLSKVQDVKTVVVKKTFIPLWCWLVMGIFAVLWAYGWIPKIKKRLTGL